MSPVTIACAGSGATVRRLQAVLRAVLEDEPVRIESLDREPHPAAVIACVEEAKARLRRWLTEYPGQRWILVGKDCAEAAIWALRQGASDYLSWSHFEAKAEVGKARLTAALKPAAGAGPVIEAAATRDAYRLARRVAPKDVPVFIQGPSGSGKEVLAQFVHAHSLRAQGPFVAVNCAAIPENMLEATLFGHERGAFTGADRARRGKFLEAAGGTLLLDEVTEMALELQPKLLRTLQEQEVEPLGAKRPVPTDVRVIATSNRNLRQTVADGAFREDLFFRLNVFPLSLPPLRERQADILPLAERFAAAEDVVLSPAAATVLTSHRWPGNVRELQNCITRASIITTNSVIDATDLGLVSTTEPTSLRGQVAGHEDQLILEALRTHEGHRRNTAAALGMSERTLRYRLARLRAAGAAL